MKQLYSCIGIIIGLLTISGCIGEGLIILLIIGLLSMVNSALSKKDCHYCKARIHEDAIKCPKCGSNLTR